MQSFSSGCSEPRDGANVGVADANESLGFANDTLSVKGEFHGRSEAVFHEIAFGFDSVLFMFQNRWMHYTLSYGLLAPVLW